ncbi:MAG: M48 family metallopeptidase [Candidatus Omnitrophota bacterium]
MTGADPRAKEYHRAKLRLLAADLFISGAFLFFLQVSGASAFLAGWAGARGLPKTLEVLLYLSVFFNLLYLVSLPVHFYSSYRIEKKFSLSTQKLTGWIWDALKKYFLSFVFFSALLELLYFTVERFPDAWWMLAGAGWLFITLFLSRILPTLIIPLFYKLKALPTGELRDRLTGLLKNCRVRVLDLYEIALSSKTKKANAALVGIGKSRRVLLGDTLLQRFSVPEIEMVVAHEVGHHVKRHILKSLAFNLAATLLGFYLLRLLSVRIAGFLGGQGLTDLSIFPGLALLASAAGLVLLPAQNAFSRWMENEADRFALATIPSKEVFVSLMNKLASQNLSDPAPNPALEFLLYDHPSISRRIRRAEKQFNA